MVLNLTVNMELAPWSKEGWGVGGGGREVEGGSL